MTTKVRTRRVVKKAARGEKHTHSTLGQYLREIGEIALLTAEDEKRLAERIARGDKEARQQFLRANLRLVVNIAKQYVPSRDGDILMDLIQEGNMGLMRAVDRFKPGYNTRFSTYGVYWIRQAVLRALKSRRIVRLPENVVDRVLAMQRLRQRLYQELGRAPTPEELAVEMKTTRAEIDRLEEAASEVVSLDRAIRGRDDEAETPLQDLLEDYDTPRPSEMAQSAMATREVREAVATLPAREREIVELRFGMSGKPPMTLEEIGETFAISRERVRQLQNVALDRLRKRQGVVNVRAV